MTQAESKSSYGLISRTIISTMAGTDVQPEQVMAFSMYMQYGIVEGACTLPEQRREVAGVILQWLKARATGAGNDQLKKMLEANKPALIAMAPQQLGWYSTWVEHCRKLCAGQKSYDNCFELLEILRDSMELSYEDVYESMSILREVFRHQRTMYI